MLTKQISIAFILLPRPGNSSSVGSSSFLGCYCCGNTFGMLKVIANSGALTHAPGQRHI